MLFPLLATRLLARNVAATSRLVLRRVPTAQVTRTFSVSRVAWATAATKAKPSAKKTAAKKRPARKPATKATKKPAAKKKVKKAAPKPKKVKAKKPVIRVLPEHKPPKLPGSPFIYFYRKLYQGAQRQEGEEALAFSARVMKEAGASWRAFSEQEKQPFRDECAAARAEYEKKIETYTKNTDPAIIREINRRRKAKGKRRVKVKSHTLITGYLIFCKEQRTNTARPATFAENSELLKELNSKWKALSDAEKASYNEKAKAAIAASES